MNGKDEEMTGAVDDCSISTRTREGESRAAHLDPFNLSSCQRCSQNVSKSLIHHVQVDPGDESRPATRSDQHHRLMPILRVREKGREGEGQTLRASEHKISRLVLVLVRVYPKVT